MRCRCRRREDETDASGVATSVRQDDMAGTDPTNALSKFTVASEMKDGAPIVAWVWSEKGQKTTYRRFFVRDILDVVFGG